MRKRTRSESPDEESSYFSDALKITERRQFVDAREKPTTKLKIKWKTTFEDYEDMEESVPELVKRYEVTKTQPVECVLGPIKTDPQTDIAKSRFLVERRGGKRFAMSYRKVREEHPDFLIDYYVSKIRAKEMPSESPAIICLDDEDEKEMVKPERELILEEDAQAELPKEERVVKATVDYMVDQVSQDSSSI
ncbi:hypothetical protein L596_011683 [Steinernema carpocapsae]|nr:hypothetical protein L596_011683 [Steinernema carpocapsae]